MPNESAIVGLKRAWSIACALKERALAEYIFEKMEPYLSAAEASHCANQLQSLALDKLAEFGLSREAIAKMTGLSPDGAVNPSSFKLVHLGTIPQANGDSEGDGSASPSHSALADRDDNVASELDEGLLKDLDEVFGESNNQGIPSVDGAGQASDGNMSLVDMLDHIKDALAPEPRPAVEGLDELSLEEKFSNALPPQSNEDAPAQTEADSVEEPETLPEGEWDPEAAPTLTSDGLSLGPGFGLRAKPADEDAEGEQFEDMLKNLGMLMDGFDSRTGESITAPAGNQTSQPLDERQVQIITYADLVGYSQAIQTMQSFGIGMRDDPDYLMLVDALNQLHGVDKVPATDAMLFRSLAREDANKFMEATANEIDLPMLRLSMDENLQGAFMLCLSIRADKAPQMNRQRTSFEGPAILCLEDIDLWMAPTEMYDEDGVPWTQRLTRGARETVQMIRAAVQDPNVYVMATMSSFGEIDPFFCDLLTPFSVIDIDVPNEFERADIWRALMREHPSLGSLRLSDLVRFSANLPRADIYTAAREALEEAYKQSLSMRTYLPVTYDNLLEKISAYQPIDSQEYQDLENEVAGSLRTELDSFDSVDALLGLDDGDEPADDRPFYDPDTPINTDNPYFSL